MVACRRVCATINTLDLQTGALMKRIPKACSFCHSAEIYTRRVDSAGLYGPFLLRGLGSFLKAATFDVVVCADCGHCEFFVEEDARQNVATAQGWRRLNDGS